MPRHASTTRNISRGWRASAENWKSMDVLAAYVAAGGSVQDAAKLVGIQPSTVKRHVADLRSRMGLTTEQLIYAGRAGGYQCLSPTEPHPDRAFQFVTVGRGNDHGGAI
jgi:hypothetical protein